MRAISVIISAATAVTTLTAGLGTASAAPVEHAINGTYQATSNGDWAKTNEVYMDEPTVQSTWTITSSCRTAQDCIGRVTSDQGWTEAVRMGVGDTWRMDRILENWVTCEDRSAFPGHQIYRFQPMDATAGNTAVGSPILAGWDKTVGPSGACGRNMPLTINMPFKLVKIG